MNLLTDNPVEEYIVNNLTLSVVGTNAALASLTGYADFVIERSTTITDETQMMAVVNEIRETSIDTLSEMEMLKISLDRFLFSDEDIEDPLETLAKEQDDDISRPSIFARILSVFSPQPQKSKRMTRFRNINDVMHAPIGAQNMVIDDMGDADDA